MAAGRGAVVRVLQTLAGSRWVFNSLVFRGGILEAIAALIRAGTETRCLNSCARVQKCCTYTAGIPAQQLDIELGAPSDMLSV